MEILRGSAYRRFEASMYVRNVIRVNKYFRLHDSEKTGILQCLYAALRILHAIDGDAVFEDVTEDLRLTEFLYRFANRHIRYCNPQTYADNVLYAASREIAMRAAHLQGRLLRLLLPFQVGETYDQYLHSMSRFFYTKAIDETAQSAGPLLRALVEGNIDLSILFNFYFGLLFNISPPANVFDCDADIRMNLSDEECLAKLMSFAERNIIDDDISLYLPNGVPPSLERLQRLYLEILENDTIDRTAQVINTAVQTDTQEAYEQVNMFDPDA